VTSIRRIELDLPERNVSLDVGYPRWRMTAFQVPNWVRKTVVMEHLQSWQCTEMYLEAS
jgi:hypothetical protein